MIEATYPSEVDLPALTLAPDTMFTHHGLIECNGAIIRIPGLPPNNYTRITVFGGQHDVHLIAGDYIQLRTDLKKSGSFVGYFNSGYARDDGRNKANWQIEGISIQDGSIGKVRFSDRFTVGRLYSLYVVNNILKADGTYITAGTKYDIVCKVNFQPTMLTEASAEAGRVTLEFSQDIAQEGSIAGIDYDYLEYDENKLHIYTTSSGEFRLQIADFFDIYENPVDDAEVDVSIPANNETTSESDGTYSMKYRSRYDYEDIVLARGFKWLQTNGIR
jgi:hypothetical protein